MYTKLLIYFAVHSIVTLFVVHNVVYNVINAVHYVVNVIHNCLTKSHKSQVSNIMNDIMDDIAHSHYIGKAGHSAALLKRRNPAVISIVLCLSVCRSGFWIHISVQV